ncbi:MAG: DUF262 domain-containing protein [Gemmatimonadota bacterium]|nr:DUF262 domain-containing protein [Gemmatimonadota bacterium]
MTNSPLIGQTDLNVDDDIIDDSEKDDSAPQVRYDITSYGVDFDVEGIVRRLDDGDIVIPEWQRSFIWTLRTASSFIESLLLGLPVPGVFLGKDPASRKLYVIDGQQRLKTLQYFYNSKFPKTDGSHQNFVLQNVSDRFEGLCFSSLDDADRRDLNNSLIHATVVRQDTPPGDDTSMYQIFSRLNTGGRVVNPHEIRCAIYQGDLIDNIKKLNELTEWRRILGKPSQRLKDQEMILRFMALWHAGDEYKKSMAEFLNVFTQRNRTPDKAWLNDIAGLFKQTVTAFAEAKGREAFRLHKARAVNAAVLDSMMVGLAKRIVYRDNQPTSSEIGNTHDSLTENQEYLDSVTQGTSDESSVRIRLQVATAAFADAE